jgi:hypothetical protein
MMHLPAKHVRNEMLSLQQLIRACLSTGAGAELEPTLVVKTKSLSLKYLLKSSKIRFLVGRTHRQNLIYGILVDDDPGSPISLWSLVERNDELEAVRRIVAGEQFMLAMFNEAVVNICGGLLTLRGCVKEIKELFQNVKLAAESESETMEGEVSQLLDDWHASGAGLTVLTSEGNHDWGPNQCSYITNQLETSRLDLLHSNEGGQQEQLAAWITDVLHPRGVFQNPIARENIPRELCDLLFTHQFGTILFESKALSILSRADLPTRDKLQSVVAKHIQKALRQLAGACKNLKTGIPVLTSDGREIRIQRELPPHCVVIIPDLTLLSGTEIIVLAEIADFVAKTKAFVNILDPSQLFSLMMDSNNLAHRGQTTTPLMAFDCLLIQRFDSVIQKRDPAVITLCRFETPEVGSPSPK